MGPFIKVFDVRAGLLLAEMRALPFDNVHGMRVLEGDDRIGGSDDDRIGGSGIAQCSITLCVFGGKSVRLIGVQVDSAVSAEGDTVFCRLIALDDGARALDDWIRDVHWIDDGCRLAVAFSHNFVQIWSTKRDDEDRMILDSVESHTLCEERCIIYAARFRGNTSDSLEVATGTVFNEVLLWRPMRGCNSTDAPVEQRLRGHEGVIFSVRFSADGNHVVSVSDDRSVRVWDRRAVDASASAVILYGHQSRVWDAMFHKDVRLTTDNKDNGIPSAVISVSEDATCRAWDLSSKREISCWKGHSIRNAWTMDISADGRILVYTECIMALLRVQ